jgi:hypothetical protein
MTVTKRDIFVLLVLSTVKTLFFVLFLSSSTIICSLYISFLQHNNQIKPKDNSIFQAGTGRAPAK